MSFSWAYPFPLPLVEPANASSLILHLYLVWLDKEIAYKEALREKLFRSAIQRLSW
jgi:hypothetical protein